MPDGTEQKPPQDSGTPPPQDAAYWQNEAKAAFAKRDELNKRVRDLEGRALPDHEIAELRDAKAKLAQIEEERQKKAGEWDQILKKKEETWTTQLTAAQQRAAQLEAQIADEKIANAFNAAEALFGPGGETVIPADVAASYFGKHVAYEDVEIAGKTVRAVVVKDDAGNIVRGADGHPAPFADALRQVIKAMPQDKQDRLLRGSGKTGSGHSNVGNQAPAWSGSVDELIAKARAGDKDAIKRLSERDKQISGFTVGSALRR